MGGARNPMIQFSDDSVTKEQPKNQVSTIETTTTQVPLKEEKKQIPEGPRPGDRFKQLKEEEARKRKQREEEARKANVVAENNVSVINGELKTETDSVEIEDRRMESLYADDLLAIEKPSLNGNQSHQELKKDQEISSQRMEDDENLSNCSFEKDGQQHLHKNLKKEEAVATLGPGKNTFSGDDTKNQDRS